MSEQPTNRVGPLYWLMGRSRRFWIITAALPVLYVASLGPACWITSRMRVGQDSVTMIYRPITRTFMRVPVFHEWGREIAILSDTLKWYSGLGAADNWGWSAIIADDRRPQEITWTWEDDPPPPMWDFRVIRTSFTAPPEDSDDPNESSP